MPKPLPDGQRLPIGLDPPKSIRDAHDLFIATLAIRARAAVALQQAMGDAIGTQPGPTAVGELVNAGRAIAAGDQAYSLFVAAVPKQSTPMPPSQWITDDQAWSEPLLTTFVTTLRSSASMIPVHDLSVVLVSLDPTPVAFDGGSGTGTDCVPMTGGGGNA